MFLHFSLCIRLDQVVADVDVRRNEKLKLTSCSSLHDHCQFIRLFCFNFKIEVAAAQIHEALIKQYGLLVDFEVTHYLKQCQTNDSLLEK